MNEIINAINQVLPQEEGDYLLKISKAYYDEDIDCENYTFNLIVKGNSKMTLNVACRESIEGLIDMLSYEFDSDKIILEK